MAQFCTKCGTPLPEGMKFCTGCGAAVSGQPPTPAAPGPAREVLASPGAQAPVAAAPSPAPRAPAAGPSSSSPVLKIVLIILAVLIFLGLLSAGACVYFLYRTKQRVTQFEKQVHATFPVPTGTREGGTQPAAPAGTPGQETAPVIDMDVPVYPGATASEGGPEVSAAGGKVRVQQYATSDSLDKVVAFYREKMGSVAVVTQSASSALVHVVGSNGVIDISIASDSGSGKTTFTITSILR